MKKSQAQTQIFIYILALVIVSLILLYGYNSIKKLREQTSAIEHIQFKTDLETSIERINFEFGTVEKKSFIIPGSFKQVCFLELERVGDISDENKTIIRTNYPIIGDIIDSIIGDVGVKENIFLVKSITEESFFIDNISPDGIFHCFNITRGRLNLKLEALGKKVRISEP